MFLQAKGCAKQSLVSVPLRSVLGALSLLWMEFLLPFLRFWGGGDVVLNIFLNTAICPIFVA